MSATAADHRFMAHALQLAARGLYTTDPNPRVGCVLVRDGAIVGEGWHERAGGPHAEVVALRAAGGAARGATAYVTLEPCNHTGRTGPCAEALVGAGVARVECATADPNTTVGGGGTDRLRAAGVEVGCGLMAAAARELNPGFFSRFERSRPFVRLKLAMSLDGRTAGPGPGRVRITGEPARLDVQHWRARSSAVLTGSGTVRSDDPRLDVRLDYGPWIRQPLRVVLDTRLACPAGAQVFRDHGALLFVAGDEPAPDPAHAAVRRVAAAPEGLDLAQVLAVLARDGINELLVECGARLAGSFLRAGLVDELIVYVAAHFVGADGAPLAALDGAAAGSLSCFVISDMRRVGQDLRLTMRPKVSH